MITRPPAYSADNPIQNKSITFVIDTNILMEFDALPQIDWSLLCPNAQSITVVAPITVVREVDNHKKGAPRLRRRALEFNTHLASIEDGNGTDIELCSVPVPVRLKLMPRYPRSELSTEGLSLDVNDDLIAAEAARFAQDEPTAIFLADDNNARRTARDIGLSVARPPDAWRRKEPRDERDAELDKLRRQVGAMPKLVIAAASEGAGTVCFQSVSGEQFSDALQRRMIEAIRKLYPGKSRSELMRRYGLRGNQFDIMANSSIRGVSVHDIDRYCEKHQNFLDELPGWVISLPDLLSEHFMLYPFEVEVANEGLAFAHDLVVSLNVSEGFEFAPEFIVQHIFNLKVSAPDPPKGHDLLLGNVPSMIDFQRDIRRDPFSFYRRDDGERDYQSEISYECERFRHGENFVLSGYLARLKDGPSGGAVTVRASSATLADPVERCFPIRATDEPATDFEAYLRERLMLFPDDLRAALEAALDEE